MGWMDIFGFKERAKQATKSANGLGDSSKYLNPLFVDYKTQNDGSFLPQSKLFTDAYGSTGIVFMVVSKIARKAKSLPMEFQRPTRRRNSVPSDMQALNELTSGMCNNFMNRIYTSYLVAGEAFVCSIPFLDSDVPQKLIVPRPFDVTIIENSEGKPTSYSVISENRTWTLSPNNVLHIKTPNMVELDDDRGFSTLQALRNEWQASKAIARNEYFIHKNHGANVLISAKGGRPMSPQHRNERQDQYDKVINAAQRVGKTAFISEEVTVQPLSIKPKDLDSVAAQTQLKRDIAAAFDVPSLLIGDATASTYNNMEQAKRMFITDAVLPLTDDILEPLNPFLQRKLNISSELTVLRDQIPELGEVESQLSSKVIAELNAGILTVNEARSMLHNNLEPLVNDLEDPQELTEPDQNEDA